jgi:hypothetical protein
VPLVALTEYWKDEGENGPPGGPETAMLVSGVTTNAGAGGRADFWAEATDVTSKVCVAASIKVRRISRMAVMACS